MNAKSHKGQKFKIGNREYTAIEAEAVFGINRDTIRDRYRKGDRDTQLVRPVEHTNFGPRAPRARNETPEQVEQRKLAAERKEQRERNRRKEAESHRLAFSRPLISDSLLSADERKAILQRVLNSGQRSWAVTGVSMGASV